MNPRLVAIAGPLQGASIPLPAAECTIGRGSGCHFRIDDEAVSRQHCVIRRAGERFTVQDLGSNNGTHVNGVAVTERDVTPGDAIQIGTSVFMFLTTEEELTDISMHEPSTIEFPVLEGPYVPSKSGGMNLPESARTRQDLESLLRLSTLLYSFRTLGITRSISAREKLSQHLLSLLLEMVPADGGQVLVAEEARTLARDPKHKYLKRVCEERVALCLDNALLAAPVLVQDNLAAVVCLTTTGQRFDERQLELLVTVAGMAGVAWDNAVEMERLHEQNKLLQTELDVQHPMIGQSPLMAALKQQIARAAQSAATVLIRGESGTGKELVARAIHANSPRAVNPFVAINCAALTDTLLESELFGHEKGAFTGAILRKKGKIEVADGGTLFLDEIGELAIPLQAKLLRVLQEREFDRVGGTVPIKVDVRVVAASNCDLEEAIRKGKFRQDLYYRLNVVLLQTPSLRQRPEDIRLLAESFVTKHASEAGRKVMGISQPARAYLESYSWPGNVRELENAIQRAIVLGMTDFILPEDLPEHIREAAQPREPPAGLYEQAVAGAKRQVILRAFEQAGHNHDLAARLLDVHPNYLHRLIRMMDLRTSLKEAAQK